MHADLDNVLHGIVFWCTCT